MAQKNRHHGLPQRSAGCIWVLLLIIVVFISLAWAYSAYQERKYRQAEVHTVKKVALWVLGGVESFGIGAGDTATWPVIFNNMFDENHKGYELHLINASIPEANTSEGLEIVEKYLARVRETQGKPHDHLAPERPDYTMILYGESNRWNLHSASFAKWENPPQSEGLTRAMKLLGADDLAGLVKKGRKDFYGAVEGNGFDVFFPGFEDSLLSEWLEKDVTSMIKAMRENNVEPMLLTYYFDQHAELNRQIRKIAEKEKVPLIELEKPMPYYEVNGMLQKYEETVFLNEKGAAFVAGEIYKAFSELFPKDKIEEHIARK